MYLMVEIDLRALLALSIIIVACGVWYIFFPVLSMQNTIINPRQGERSGDRGPESDRSSVNEEPRSINMDPSTPKADQSISNPKQISLTLSIDKQTGMILFAKSKKDFVEVLFSFLTLPMGEIVRLCGKKSGIPPLNNLYASVEALDVQSFQTAASKNMLLHPRSAHKHSSVLAIDIDQKEPSLHYICSRNSCRDQNGFRLVSLVKGSECICKRAMEKEICVKAMIADNTEGFLEDRGDFIISDDLVVLPATVPNIKKLISREMKSSPNTEVKEIIIGTKEVLQILKHLTSGRPLTSALLRDNGEPGQSSILNWAADPYTDRKLSLMKKRLLRGRQCVPIEKVRGNLLVDRSTRKIIGHEAQEDGQSSILNWAADPYTDRKLSLMKERLLRGRQCVPIEKVRGNLLVDRSTRKIIGLEAQEDILDLMFSFLTIPLGSVVKLCSKRKGCLSNLYRSIEQLHVDNFKSERSKNLLLSPKIAPNYDCKSQLLKIDEETEPRFNPCCKYIYICYKCFLKKIHCSHGSTERMALINPKIPGRIPRGGGFLKKKGTLIITNDLRIEYLQPALHVRQVNPLDVCVIGVDLDEVKALKILSSLMTSANVLTNAYMMPLGN